MLLLSWGLTDYRSQDSAHHADKLSCRTTCGQAFSDHHGHQKCRTGERVDLLGLEAGVYDVR